MKKLLLITLGILFFEFGFAQLRSGPMLGYAEHREVAIWLQTQKQDAVQLEFRLKGIEKWKNAGTKLTRASEAYTAHYVLGNLEPGSTYEYRFLVTTKMHGKETPFEFKTQALWQWREEPPAFKIALGSCNYVSEAAYDRPGESYGGDYQIFEKMADAKPDMMLWLGDNTYLREVDWSSRSGIVHRYNHTRQLPEMQRLLAVCPNYAIWDDHDFGPNDANGSWVHKRQSLDIFKLFWANNGYGLPELEGTTGAFRFNDLDFILLDNRYHRSSERLKDSCARQMLGEAQIDWLINALKFSTASFKIVAVGSQVLNSEALYENYAQFPCERQRLLDRIAAEEIKNVIFATGDRNHSEISRVEQEGIVMYDITASPLTSKAGNSRVDENNRHRVAGSLILQRNYTTLEVSGTRKARQLLLRNFDSSGQEIFSYTIPQQP